MTTRGPAAPGRRSGAARPAPTARRAMPEGALRRDGRSSNRARPNRAATPRPAPRRAAATGPSAGSAGAGVPPAETPGRQLTVTTRAALLALTLCLVALTMAYPLRAYLTQRSTIADLQVQQRQDAQAVADLRRTVAQYQNPVSVQDEARRRLHYQLPGEKVYYLPAAPPPEADTGERVHTPAVPGKEDQPWYAQLWGTAVETSK